MTMHLDVVTPEKTLYSGEVKEVVADTADGQIGVLPHHINLVSKLLPGELVVKGEKKTEYFGIVGGFIQVANNVVTVLADYAVRSEDIEVQRALDAQKRAEEILRQKKEGISEKDFATAHAELAKALMEIKVARRHHKNIPQIVQ